MGLAPASAIPPGPRAGGTGVRDGGIGSFGRKRRPDAAAGRFRAYMLRPPGLRTPGLRGLWLPPVALPAARIRAGLTGIPRAQLCSARSARLVPGVNSHSIVISSGSCPAGHRQLSFKIL